MIADFPGGSLHYRTIHYCVYPGYVLSGWDLHKNNSWHVFILLSKLLLMMQ